MSVVGNGASGEVGDAPKRAIGVLSRATDVLRVLHGEDGGLSLSQISERSGLPRSTVHRLVTALEHEGLVTAASPAGRIRLGPELLRLAGGGAPQVETILRPLMEQLFAELRETVDLAVLHGDHLRFVHQIPAPHRLRAVSAVGASFPLHCTANGKAVLALVSPDELERLLPPRLARHTPNTITSRARLLEELKGVRASGLAVDREEHTIGISAMGFAVATATAPVTALSVPMPTQRFTLREPDLRVALTTARSAALSAVDGGAQR